MTETNRSLPGSVGLTLCLGWGRGTRVDETIRKKREYEESPTGVLRVLVVTDCMLEFGRENTAGFRVLRRSPFQYCPCSK
ncbi:protein of unknown function [Kyrpidia spormannii]|uniref:Uncharacterized protein n=2 Tax=Kyrpidia spormannii TaxID=2055160 RepID=A0ACA8ZCH3_9BACL|nr:protein of unknown function [Kyrpidia spormannii]CAB3395481.1 protein of unknown function [Kyrpidia spormannii]